MHALLLVVGCCLRCAGPYRWVPLRLESEGEDGCGRGGSQPFPAQPYGCYATAEKANHASNIAVAPQRDETGAGRLSCCPAEVDPIAWGPQAGCNSSVPGPSPTSGSRELKHLETQTVRYGHVRGRSWEETKEGQQQPAWVVNWRRRLIKQDKQPHFIEIYRRQHLTEYTLRSATRLSHLT